MIYIVTSTTTNVPNFSSGPIMGVHGSLKEAHAHMDLCVNSVAGGKLCWDISSKGGCVAETSEHSVRRAMISRADGGSTVIAIEGWDIRRVKRAKKAATSSDVLTEALDAIMDKNEE
jgi:hypothetical protein